MVPPYPEPEAVFLAIVESSDCGAVLAGHVKRVDMKVSVKRELADERLTPLRFAIFEQNRGTGARLETLHIEARIRFSGVPRARGAV